MAEYSSAKNASDEVFEFICGPCNVDGYALQAKGYCSDCKDYLCGICFKHHLRPKPSRHHILLDEYAMPKDKMAVLSAKKASDICTERCEKHSGNIIEYYCQSHDFLGCTKCFISDNHRKCEGVVCIEDKANGLFDSREYKNFEGTVEQLAVVLSESSSIQHQNEETINIHSICAKDDIKNFRASMNKILDGLENEMDNQVCEMKDRQMSKLMSTSGQIEELEKLIKTILETIERTRSLGQKSNFYIYMKRNMSLLKRLDDRVKMVKEDSRILGYTFTPNGNLLGQKAKNAFGTLVVMDDKRLEETNKNKYGYNRDPPIRGSSGGLFGQSTTASPGGLFGQPASSTTSSGGVFGAAPTSGTGFGATTSGSAFGFGQTAAAPAFGKPAFGQSSGFGQSTSSSPGFGAPAGDSNSSGGGGGMFSGLGGTPSAEKASTNVFGVAQTFGTTPQTSETGLFGSSTSQTFGGGYSGGGLFSGAGGSGAGTFGSGTGVGATGAGTFESGTGVGATGFGSGQAITGFGGSPAFGGAPAFGSAPAFGTAPTFGSQPGGSTFSTTPAAGAGFAGFASAGSPSFGALAQSTDTPTFGALNQSGSGEGAPTGFGGGFGSPTFGTAWQQPAFGTAPQQPAFGGGGGSTFGYKQEHSFNRYPAREVTNKNKDSFIRIPAMKDRKNADGTNQTQRALIDALEQRLHYYTTTCRTKSEPCRPLSSLNMLKGIRGHGRPGASNPYQMQQQIGLLRMAIAAAKSGKAVTYDGLVTPPGYQPLPRPGACLRGGTRTFSPVNVHW